MSGKAKKRVANGGLRKEKSFNDVHGATTQPATEEKQASRWQRDEERVIQRKESKESGASVHPCKEQLTKTLERSNKAAFYVPYV